MKELFGTYNIRARINVGLIFLGPFLFHGYLLIPEVRSISSTFIISLITLSLCSLIIVLSRMYGSNALKKCYPNGLPAQTYLLPENNYIDPLTKKRYYHFFESHIPGFKVTNNSDEMSIQTQSAVSWLIAQTRDASQFPIIAEENMNLGFAYNLLGLKPLAIILYTILLLFDNILLLSPSCAEFVSNRFNLDVCTVITSFWLFIWIIIINQKLVRNCGKKYARALLSACDSPILNNGTTGIKRDGTQ